MKRSEKTALGSVVGGIAAGVALWHFTDDAFSTWVYWLVGVIVAGGLYQNLLRIIADESIVDSKTINRK
ncbi:hypothetical protein NUJ30_08225 [Burkholderia contaminans]|uniref:hypothetical protein n=1 Tax=Burkholderia TaxID=32008 RepID=UPI0010F45169|nr:MULTISPECIES: hypothetical protein [Burkholderia]MBD1412899.1 hypothetical protein [Burkholderia contaminans]UXZ68652.1 hypothetical protein NUJ29_08230 [Burkholderia contaminans]UXZ76413.1 hypothetical protein NUJ30_08225 [Burkholderia contaminans]